MDFQSVYEKYGLERQYFYRNIKIQHYYVNEVKGQRNSLYTQITTTNSQSFRDFWTVGRTV